MPPTVYIAGAIVIVVVVRRFSPMVAAGLGMGLSVTLGIWGHLTYASGKGIAFATMALSEPAFFVLIAIWFGIEAYALFLALKRRKEPAEEAEID